MWSTRKGLFAVTDAGQTEWMRQNDQVFEVVYAGKAHSIYSVNMANLIEGLDQ